MEQYQKLNKLGEGSYGDVYKGRHILTGAEVALKEVKWPNKSQGVPKTTIREVSLLKQLVHDNIVRLLDVVYVDDKICLAFEYMDMDLKDYMMKCQPLSRNPDMVKGFLYQILCGIVHCHSQDIIHRDLKTRNLLIDKRTNTIKIADFGLARALDVPGQSITPQRMTLWYGAPEILLGSQEYSSAVDIWSVGCIFGEMISGGVPFCGRSKIDQLNKIFSVLGSPTEDTWPGVMSLPFFPPGSQNFPPKELRTIAPALDQVGLDLLAKMLCLDPSKRIDAKSAMEHEYFHFILCVTEVAFFQNLFGDSSSLKAHYV